VEALRDAMEVATVNTFVKDFRRLSVRNRTGTDQPCVLPQRTLQLSSSTFKQVPIMQTLLVEIRAAEGGADAKRLVSEQANLYVRRGNRNGL